MEVKTLETAIVVIYMLLCLGIGFYYSKKALSSEEEYWVASRFLGETTGALAVFAVVGSASTVIGITGLAYSVGLPYAAAVGMSFATQFPMVAYLTLKPIREKNICTLGEYFKETVGGMPVQAAYVAMSVIFLSAYVVPQLKASALLGQWLVGGSYQTSVIFMGVTFLLYSSIGGMWAVTITDILQGGLMFIGGIIIAFMALVDYGGIANLVEQSVAARPQLANIGMPILSLIGLASTWALWGLVAPATVMRILTMKSIRSARRSMAIGSIFAVFAVCFVATIVAMAASLISATELTNPDMAYIVAVEKFFPPVIRGFMLATIFAAIMSSTDSLLLAVSATVARDIYKNMINPKASEKTVIKIGAVTIWVVGIIVIWISTMNLPLISLLSAWCSTGIISSIGAPLVIGLYWKKVNQQGTFAGIVGGFVTYMALNLTKSVPAVSELLFATPASAVLTIVVSMLTQKPSQKMPETLNS